MHIFISTIRATAVAGRTQGHATLEVGVQQGGGAASVPGGNTDQGRQEELLSQRCPEYQGCGGLHDLGDEPCHLHLHMAHRKG